MKKKSLLVFLLAMASTATIGAAGCKNVEDDVHEHNWSLNHNANYHWYSCDDCDLEKDSGAHVDVLNNESGENGKDGLCDVCGEHMPTVESANDYTLGHDEHKHWKTYESGEVVTDGHIDLVDNESGEDGKDGLCDVCGEHIKETVTFIVSGKGTAPAVQSVNYGGHAEQPEEPKEQGFVFGGWYEDDTFKTQFNFDEKVITGSTLVYAKWEEDTTPGYSEKYPCALELEDANSIITGILSFNGYDKVYFTYTAEETGRYDLYLLNNSQACTFTTNLSASGTSYTGSAKMHFDLEEGETVVVELTRGESTTDTQKVGVYVAPTTSEDLPEAGWTSGIYESGSYTLELDRDAMTAKWGAFDVASLSYVGGIVDKATFTVSSGGLGNATFTLTYNDGVLTVTCSNTIFLAEATDFAIPVPVTPIALEKFSGVYTVERGGVTDTSGVTVVEIGICEDGSGYILNANDDRSTFEDKYVEFDQPTNTLTYSGYDITVNLDDDGNAESITVTFNKDTVEYTRTGDAGATLPTLFAELESGATYAGNDYYFTVGINTYLNGSSYRFLLVNYTQDDKTYKVKVNNVKYLVTIDDSSDDISVIFKDEDGEILDTLTKFTIDSSISETSEKTVKASDFTFNLYHMTVKETGWYVITPDAEDVELYVMNSYTTNYLNVSELPAFESGKPIYLNEGETVAVSNAAYADEEDALESYKLSIVKTDAPEGYSDENPLVIDEVGTHELGTVLSGYDYYVTFDVDAGDYFVTVSYDSYGSVSYMLYYTVNGGAHGYDSGVWAWVGGLSSNNPVARVAAGSDGLELVISKNNFSNRNITVKVEKDYTVAENAIEVEKLGSYDVAIFAGEQSYVTITAPEDKGYVLSLGGETFSFNVSGDSKTTYNLAAGETITLSIACEDQTYVGTATLIVEIDYTENADELKFTNIPMGSSIISFTNGGETGTSKNYYLEDTLGGDIFVSANGAFTVNYPDGTKAEAVSENGSYLVTIPASKNLYFNVTATNSVTLFFATSYGVGSLGNPKNPVFDELTYSEAFAAGTEVYFVLPVGTYSYSSTDRYETNSELYVNDKQVSTGTLNIAEGDVLYFVVSNHAKNGVTVTFTALVANSIQGDYFYASGSTTVDVTVSSNSIKVGETTYKLSEFTATSYTFDNGSATVTLTVNGSVVSLDNKVLSPKTLGKDVVGTYTGMESSSGTTLTLTIKSDYTAEYLVKALGSNGNTYNVKLSFDGEKYSFKYVDGTGYNSTAKFKIVDGSIVSFEDDGPWIYNMTLEKQVDEAEVSLAGTYKGGGDVKFTLVISSDNTVMYTYDNGSESSFGPLDLVEEDGTYSFSYDDYGYTETGTFTINDDGTLTFEDSYNSFGTACTLTKQ